MKKCIIGTLLLVSFLVSRSQSNLDGAWEFKTDEGKIIMIIADSYMAMTHYDVAGKTFIGTHGGRISSLAGSVLTGITEFNTSKKMEVGKEFKIDYKLNGEKMMMTHDNSTVEFTRLDNGGKNLAGNWRITQREQNGQLTPIHTTGPRKTIKILSATRFQWAAINTETGEFFGTGGGTYTFKDGIYTENIEFFSRDSSRVGMSLSFNGKLEKNDWYHSGKSSKGDPINEVWSRK
jgi:hypothetical protein